MKNMGKKRAILILFSIIAIISINSYAHSGKTDSSGGHKDNKNKSGLGSYHYHCGGYPAHLHTNGVCPYSSSSTKTTTTTKKSNSSNTSSSSTKSTTSSTKASTTENEAKTVEAESITIEVSKKELEVGETINMIASILPDNTTNKQITWSSSDEKIATVDDNGKIEAKNKGNVTIKATTSNGKQAQSDIVVKKIEKEETKTNQINTVPVISNSVTGNTEETDPVATLGAIAVLGGGGFWGYHKYKNSKKS